MGETVGGGWWDIGPGWGEYEDEEPKVWFGSQGADGGLTQKEVDNLMAVASSCPEVLDHKAATERDLRRLEFARWLYERGKINEGDLEQPANLWRNIPRYKHGFRYLERVPNVEGLEIETEVEVSEPFDPDDPSAA